MLGQELHEAVLDGDVCFGDAVQTFSRQIIASVLKYYGGNITKTAKALGVNRQSMSMMIKRRMTPGKVFTPLKKPRKK